MFQQTRNAAFSSNPIKKHNPQSRNKLGRAAASVLESLESRCLMTAVVWTGNGGDGQWNTAANWQGNAVPASSADVDFPNLGSGTQTINLASNVTVGNITFDGAGYNLSGSQINLNGNIAANADGDQISSELLPSASFSTTVAATDNLIFSGGADDSGNGYALTKQGAGKLTVSSASYNLNSPSEITQGTVEVDTSANFNGEFVVDPGTTLFAEGEVLNISGNGGTVVLGNQGNVALYNSLNVTLGNGTTLVEAYNSSNYGEITVFNDVDVTGAKLQIESLNGTAPAAGTVITLFSNQSGNNTNGTFNNLPEGALFTQDGVNYQISYVGGGSGADVTLTVVAPAVWTDGGGDGQWNNPANWQAGSVPTSGQNVDFPNLGSTDGTVTLATNETVGDITFDGPGYTLSDSDIYLSGNITDNADGNHISAGLFPSASFNVSVAASRRSSL